MSADPVMQAPGWSQGLNRYAYVFNDPINMVDPSGFFGDSASGGGGLIGGLALGGLGNVGVQGIGMMSAGSLGAGAIGLGSFGLTFAHGIGFGSDGSSTGRQALGTSVAGSTPATQGGMNGTGQNTGVEAPVQEGARYPEGGAPGMGQGGYEGAGGQSHGKSPPALGRYISGGGLSPEAVRLLRPIFDRFGYDVARTQVAFDRGVSTATTNRNLVTLNPDFWGGRRSFEQMQVLVHEITHSAQFEKLGSARMRWRLGQERLTHIFGDVYDVPAALGGTPLSKINLVDPRFTLESIASRMEDFARTVPLP